MAALSDANIKKALEDGRLKISPREEPALLQPASYDFRIGRMLVPGGGIVDPRETKVLIRTGEWAEAETLELLEMPDDMIATFGLRSSIAHRGIIAFGGPQVDPG